jgi:hypothetical protein
MVSGLLALEGAIDGRTMPSKYMRFPGEVSPCSN